MSPRVGASLVLAAAFASASQGCTKVDVHARRDGSGRGRHTYTMRTRYASLLKRTSPASIRTSMGLRGTSPS